MIPASSPVERARAQISYAGRPPVLVSVNAAAASRQVRQRGQLVRTAIDKTPLTGRVAIRPPGDKATGLGSGVADDLIIDRKYHGGDDQAVYAYAAEDLAHLGELVGREFVAGQFGENFTTRGIDVNGALIGEQWRIGADLVVQVTEPRIPCQTFRAWIGTPGWVKTFTTVGLPGPYLRVVAPGDVQAGDQIEVSHRPEHGIAVWQLFRAMTTEPHRWAHILATCDDLTTSAREWGEEALRKRT